MEEQLKQFWERGFAVFHGVLPVGVVADALSVAEGRTLHYDPIFATVFGEDYDRKRLQAHFPLQCTQALKAVQRIVRRNIIHPANMQWRAQQWVVLKSLPGGPEQEAHSDFPAFEIARARDKTDSIQAGLMVGLLPNTKLIVYEKCFGQADVRQRRVIEFGAGDVVLFRGDLIHAGAPYADTNFRIHTTLTVKGIEWQNNAIEPAPFKAFKCRYCAFLSKSARGVYNHTRFCEGNPKKTAIVAAYQKKNAKGGTCSVCRRQFAKYNTMIKHRKKCAQMTN